MKRLFTFFIMAALTLSACNDNDDGNDDNGGDVVVTTEKISARWDLSTQSDYQSIEFFSDGTYLVVGRPAQRAVGDVQIFSGTYSIKDEVITLSGLGTLTIHEMTESSISFTFTLTGSTGTTNLTATKHAQIENTTQAELLSRGWVTINGNIASLEGYYVKAGIKVYFSRAGTYLVYNDDFDYGMDLAQWRWKTGSDEKSFEYTWTLDQWGGQTEIVIHELTEERMVLVEKFFDGSTDEISIFRPL